MSKKYQELKNLLKEEIQNLLMEEVIYDFNFKGKQFKIKFDVNANPTKKGVKVQFVPVENMSVYPNEARQLINDLQIYLNQKLGKVGLAADFDADVPYQNVIGFTIKLGSIGNMLMKALKSTMEQPLDSSSFNPTPNEKSKTKVN